jgi:hypothetical protein
LSVPKKLSIAAMAAPLRWVRLLTRPGRAAAAT